MVADLINDLRIHNNRPKRNQIRNEFADLNASKTDGEATLLFEFNSVLLEQYRERIFIRFFVQSVSELIENFESKSDNLFGLRFEDKF